MVPARLTPRRVLWLVGACVLLLPAFAAAAESNSGQHSRQAAFHALWHGPAGPLAAAHPHRKIVDDNDNDAESDDLIGDSRLAPCVSPQLNHVYSPVATLRGDGKPYRSPPIRSFTAIDPFAPRPPPVRVQL
jgi:hypothetical protein